ncbi:MAG TPA: VanZ family protein [Vicinamibacterales bacterium]|nr:VanZ family protein [Vicinamibacterales bacterium]
MIGLWLPVAAYMAAIYYGAVLPDVPAPIGFWLTDTLLHAGGYTVMALLTLRATAGGRWRGVTPNAMLLAFVISMLHGLSVEWIQMYVPTRFAEWRDVGNDALGTAAGLGAAWAWSIMRRKFE